MHGTNIEREKPFFKGSCKNAESLKKGRKTGGGVISQKRPEGKVLDVV